MLPRALLVVLATCCIVSPTRGPGDQAQTANPESYASTEAARLRRAVTLQNWDDGGDVSRFVYLHASEIFPSAVIHRNGPLSELAVAPTKAENGREEALGEYIGSWADRHSPHGW